MKVVKLLVTESKGRSLGAECRDGTRSSPLC